MSRWPCLPLGEVCEERTGNRDPRTAPEEPFLYVDIASVDNGVKEITAPKQLLGRDAPSRARKIIKRGDVIVSMTRPNLNAVAIVSPEFDNQVCSTGFCVLRSTGRLLPEFVFLFTRSKNFIDIVSGAVSGAMYPAISERFVRSVPIPLPPLPEQRRIVDILNRANGIRHLRREGQAKARQITPALFVEMFGDPGTNPKGWNVVPLGELVDRFEGGKNLQSGSDSESRYRILKVSAVTSGRFRPDQTKPAPSGYSPPGKHLVRMGDLLFSRANTVDLVGATALVAGEPRDILLPDKIWRCVWREPSAVEPLYMLRFFQHPSTRRSMGVLATGTSDSMRNISQAKLKTLRVSLPPLNLQRAFAEHVSNIQATITQQDRMAAASDRLVNSLMAELFA